ncbi:MAG: methyl-accepting chemotaxis protein [Desulfobacterales bacterium]|nr:methyl-accepting chemotaxis protein [Desulfobacterales bacterium]
MKIKHKLWLTTFGLTAIVIGMFLVTVWVTGRQKDDGLVINLAGRQRMLSQKMTKELLAFASRKTVTGQADPALAGSVRNTMQVFEMTLAALTNSGEAPLSLDLAKTAYRHCPRAGKPAYTQLIQVGKLWEVFSAKMEAVLGPGENTKEDLAWIMQNNVPLLAAMNKAVGMMQKQSEGKVRGLLYAQSVGIVLGVCFIVLAVATIRSVVKRLDTVKHFAEQMKTGDLTVKTGLETGDELGIIGNVLDEMADTLGNMFTTVSANASDLNQSSSGLTAISEQVFNDSQEVTGRSESVAAASEELSTNMNSVAAAMEQAATNVGMVSSAADQLTATFDEIASNTEKACAITGGAVTQAEEASGQVGELGQAANAIGKVVETITEISEQVNLLALNATIEAARAGEAGKGFAVVANEIKELARQTAEATGEIKTRIEGIQSSTAGTVAGIGDISNVVTEINTIVATIATAVEEQSATTREIAENVTQAAAGIDEVNENVAQSSMVTSEVAGDIATVNLKAAEMNGSSSAVRDNAVALSKLADELDTVVGQFKV